MHKVGKKLNQAKVTAMYKKDNEKMSKQMYDEVNPYNARTLVNSELLLGMNINLISMLTKILNDEKLSQEEIDKIKTTQEEMSEFIKKRTFTNKLDSKYIKTESQEK